MLLLSLKYNVTKNGFLYTDRRIGGKERRAGPKMLECLVFIGTFPPRLQGSRLGLKTQKPLMDNLWWNPDEGSKEEGALCALSLIVDVWLCGPRFWTKTPPAESGRGWIWQGGWGGWLPLLWDEVGVGWVSQVLEPSLLGRDDVRSGFWTNDQNSGSVDEWRVGF